MGKERGRRNKVSLAVIAANNHYAGFGPGTLTCSEKWLVYQNYHGQINNNKYKNDYGCDSNNRDKT
jgi:hypothetical protein